MNGKRAQLIGEALALLGDESDAARREVEWAMRSVARQRTWKKSGLYGTQIKFQKVAAKQLAGALGKLQKQLDNPDLAKYEFIDFPLDRHEFAHWIARAEAAANKPLSRTDPEDVAGHAAARAALRLLKRGLGAPLTRKGPFCRLAAFILGKPNKDMMTFCVSAKTSCIVGSKKDRPKTLR